MERKKNDIMFNFICFSYDFLKKFYVFLLLFKTSKNNFYLFSKNYSLFHFVFKKLFPKNNSQTVLKAFKNIFLFAKMKNCLNHIIKLAPILWNLGIPNLLYINGWSKVGRRSIHLTCYKGMNFLFFIFLKGSLALLKITTGYLNIVHKNIVIEE